jgi:hypothetical protein
MKEQENILELTPDLELGVDPREALYTDYLDGVRSARETLRAVRILREDALLPYGADSPWWLSFLRELAAQVESELNSNH